VPGDPRQPVQQADGARQSRAGDLPGQAVVRRVPASCVAAVTALPPALIPKAIMAARSRVMSGLRFIGSLWCDLGTLAAIVRCGTMPLSMMPAMCDTFG